MSLDDVAKVTKIQPRILERLEAGRLDGLPAEVFVRGFVRSFARCVGLDEREALRRYAACALGSQDLTPTVRALVEAMADLAPGSASAARATPRKMQAVEVIDLAGPVVLTPPDAASAEPDAASEMPSSTEPDPSVASAACAACAAVATAVEPPAPDVPMARASEPAIVPTIEQVIPVVESSPSSEPDVVAAPAAPAPSASKKKRERRRKARAAAREAAAASRESAAADAAATAEPGESAASERRASASAPWRRLARRVSPVAPTRPSLVIDDADPESAERVQEERAESVDATAPRRSSLPPILLDREDRSARQGGLTLAVIMLLIAATVTLSYLMRRPSDGVTGREAPEQRADRT